MKDLFVKEIACLMDDIVNKDVKTLMEEREELSEKQKNVPKPSIVNKFFIDSAAINKQVAKDWKSLEKKYPETKDMYDDPSENEPCYKDFKKMTDGHSKMRKEFWKGLKNITDAMKEISKSGDADAIEKVQSIIKKKNLEYKNTIDKDFVNTDALNDFHGVLHVYRSMTPESIEKAKYQAFADKHSEKTWFDIKIFNAYPSCGANFVNVSGHIKDVGSVQGEVSSKKLNKLTIKDIKTGSKLKAQLYFSGSRSILISALKK